jgi:hypothetical protein
MEVSGESQGMMVSEGVRLPLMPLNCAGQTFPAPQAMTNNEKAIAYFKSREIHAFEDDGSVFVSLGDPKSQTEVQITSSEVEYRAELYDEQV